MDPGQPPSMQTTLKSVQFANDNDLVKYLNTSFPKATKNGCSKNSVCQFLSSSLPCYPHSNMIQLTGEGLQKPSLTVLYMALFRLLTAHLML